MVFGLLKKVAGAAGSAAAREVASASTENKDFLEAVCAAVALVAAADGEIEDSERGAITRLVQSNPTLGKAYPAHVITEVSERMLALAKTSSGKQALARELDDLKGKPSAMADDVYLIAKDIAMADGEMEPAEEAVLKKIAARLGVDTSKFEF